MKQQQLTFAYLLDFARRLAPSQGHYSRLYAQLSATPQEQRDAIDETLIEEGLTTDLMDVLGLLEG